MIALQFPYLSIALLLFSGCSQKDEFEIWQEEGCVKLLLEDRENKELELIYLQEIRIAQENNDLEAYQFYFKEYLRVPRLKIPEELKSHPNYFIGGEREKY